MAYPKKLNPEQYRRYKDMQKAETYPGGLDIHAGNAYLGVTYLTLPESMTALGRSKGPNSTATQDEWGAFTAS